MQGFIIFDSFPPSVYQEFRKDMMGWIEDGSTKYKEHMVDGLENAPDAFVQLLDGGNFGKMVVNVGA
jgi:alcohol dehydrogenase